MPKPCLIILSYVAAPDPGLLDELVRASDYIICADGGQLIARAASIQPDCVIGDFDSTRTNIHLDCPYITYPAEKDITDAEAAMLHAVEASCTAVYLYGGIGGRLDHTLGTIALLLRFHADFRHIELLDGRNSMCLLEDGSMTLTASPRYRYFSLVPVDAYAYGVDIRGAKYPLQNHRLDRRTTLGISNEIAGACATISVRSGKVLVVRSSDAPR